MNLFIGETGSIEDPKEKKKIEELFDRKNYKLILTFLDHDRSASLGWHGLNRAG